MCPSPFDGIPELLEWLRACGIIIALVTGKGRRSCSISLEQYGIARFFDLVETGSPEGPCKPEGIRAVLDRFLLKPEEAIYVGDTASDVASARSAGVPAVAAAWAETADRETLRRAGADQLFPTIPAFREWLENSLGR